MSKLTELWINVTKEKEIEEYSNDVQKLYDYTIQLQQERDKYKSIVEEAIEYIKHSWWLRFDQVYDTSKDLKSWEVEQLFEILNKIKELEEGNSNGTSNN